MNKKVNVYGKDEKGNMFLLKDNIIQNEAIIISNDYYRNTGRTAVIVYNR